STLSRSTNALTLVTARSGLSSSSATSTSTSRPPSFPSRFLTARLKPLRSCWPSTAGGPAEVAMTPVFSFSRPGARALPDMARAPCLHVRPLPGLSSASTDQPIFAGPKSKASLGAELVSWKEACARGQLRVAPREFGNYAAFGKWRNRQGRRVHASDDRRHYQ